MKNPKYVKSVETACGSHTHTLVPGKGKTKGNDYLYVSSYSPRAEYPDCQTPHDLISIVKVDKANPTTAEVIATPNLFPDGGNPGGPGPTPIANRSSTTGCHDITALPHKDLAAGACMGDGIIMDIADREQPKVIERVQDNENFAFWHSATFNADATKVVFTDELGGGGAATCDAETGPDRGANAIYDLSADHELTFRSYFKIPRHQTETENCVAHNGSLIPVAGRDLMVQSRYRGWRERLGLHRLGQPARARLLRAWAVARRRGHRRHPVDVLLQRPRLLLGHRARLRRAEVQRPGGQAGGHDPHGRAQPAVAAGVLGALISLRPTPAPSPSGGGVGLSG
uniref:Uncharacterized protein n=1 Tax=Janibacter limosus TaxID=53458 RepID=A0AC61U2J1_9MICO|nr:hypothetical protein [Janibacter limosus]